MTDKLTAAKAVGAAVVGFVAPGAVVVTAAVTEGSAGSTVITTGEWITAVCACVITAAASGFTVYRVENRPKL